MDEWSKYRILVRYLDEYNEPQDHEMTGREPQYHNTVSVEPLSAALVRQIMHNGLTINIGDRKNKYIPNHRILCIWFEDSLT